MVYSSDRPLITSAYESFREIRLGYDQLAVGTKVFNFWAKAYPNHAQLVLAYMVEAFGELSCDLNTLQAGDAVPEVQRLARNKQVALTDVHLITAANGGFIRSNVPVDNRPAENLYQKILHLYPQHASVNNFVNIVGS